MPESPDQRRTAFEARLEQARGAGGPLLDLAEWDPSRCGLAGDPAELAAWVRAQRTGDAAASGDMHRAAREAVAGYLAGRRAAASPEHILLAASTTDVFEQLLRAVCDEGDQVLVPAPCRAFILQATSAARAQPQRYALRYDGTWRLDRSSVAQSVTARTRAIVVASPAAPTGAVLGREDLAFLEDLCARHDLALIADESEADATLVPAPSVAAVTKCLAFHVAGVATVCGAPQVELSWVAAAGPDALVAPALACLEKDAAAPSTPAQVALPALLARREEFLSLLRARLAQNRTALTTAALREAPWTVLNSAGGWSAVLEIGESEGEAALCLRLLDDGVAVHPGFLYGFERNKHLVVSLLPGPDVFRDGLERVEALLRGALLA